MGQTNFTVAELIAELKNLPQDLPVLISGAENGFEDFFMPVVHRVSDDPDAFSTEGRFQMDGDGDMDAVLLMREDRYD